MADRYYDRTLECGCMYSSDGGGGLMPCDYGYGCGKELNNQLFPNKKCGDIEDLKHSDSILLCDECKEQPSKCQKAHEKWHKSKDYKKYCEEVQEKNS